MNRKRLILEGYMKVVGHPITMIIWLAIGCVIVLYTLFASN